MDEETWQEEQRLIHGLRTRDPLSLEALIKHYARELFYFARLVLAGAGSVQDAEECLNDLFVAVWQEGDTFDPERGSLRTWLIMRTKYIALDCRRQLLRRQFTGVPVVALHEAYALAQGQRSLNSASSWQVASSQLTTAGVDLVLEQHERLEELRRALERLPAFDQVLVYQRYFQGASMKGMAACTGLTRHAIEVRLWRARKVLRVALQEQASDTSTERAHLRAHRRTS